MRFRITVEVEVSERDVETDTNGTIVYSNTCGDSYGSNGDFFYHQLWRDLQSMRPDRETLKVEAVQERSGG